MMPSAADAEPANMIAVAAIKCARIERTVFQAPKPGFSTFGLG
jgi:hypothetical protein